MGFTETECEIPLDDLPKFQGWERGSWMPNFAELDKYCEVKKQGSALDFFR